MDNVEKRINGVEINNLNVYQIKIEECDYLVYFDKDNNQHITHKGNCRRCTHNANMDRDAIIQTIKNYSRKD